VRVALRYFKGPELLVDFQVRVSVFLCVRACGLTLLQRTRAARGFPGACVCVCLCACVWPHATSKDQICSWISRCVCVCLCVRVALRYFKGPELLVDFQMRVCVSVRVRACVWPHATSKDQSCSCISRCVCLCFCVCVRVALRFFKGPDLLVDFQVRVCVSVRACGLRLLQRTRAARGFPGACVCVCVRACVRVASRYFKGPELLVDIQVRVSVFLCVRACGLTLLQRTRAARGLPGACGYVLVCLCCACFFVWTGGVTLKEAETSAAGGLKVQSGDSPLTMCACHLTNFVCLPSH